ncbi:transcription factor Adf-1-like [Pseudorasbora parva]|uniref:transcription factor Adf-1-like n=1 Tax=Pseudorasbora parva TaxID=51549 RepID=UPI00351E030E
MIQQRPALYHTTGKCYVNCVAKAELWREIANNLVISEKELKKRWDSLRTQYMRYKKHGPSGSSGAQKTHRQFLQPHTKRKESTSNLTIRAPLSESESCSP